MHLFLADMTMKQTQSSVSHIPRMQRSYLTRPREMPHEAFHKEPDKQQNTLRNVHNMQQPY